MRVGMAAVFQNPGRARADLDVYRDDLRLADLREPLGFDSIWSVEHHFFADLQVWDTPAQCYDKILDIRRRVGNDHFAGVLSSAGMPAAEPERSMRLIVRDAMPALQRLEPEPSTA